MKKVILFSGLTLIVLTLFSCGSKNDNGGTTSVEIKSNGGTSTDVTPIAGEFSDGKYFLCEESENGPLSIYVIDNDKWKNTIKVVWMQPWEEKHHGELDKFTYTVYDDEVTFSSNKAWVGTKDNMVIDGEASGKIDKSNNLTLVVKGKTYNYPNLREATEMEVRETFGKYEN